MASSSRCDLRVVAVAFGFVLLDVGEDLAHAVDGSEQGRRDLGRQLEIAVPNVGEDGFGGVGHRLQLAECEKSAGALDRVDRSKDPLDDLGVGGILLERDDILIHAVEILDTFGQELGNDGGHATHSRTPFVTIRSSGDILRRIGDPID